MLNQIKRRPLRTCLILLSLIVLPAISVVFLTKWVSRNGYILGNIPGYFYNTTLAVINRQKVIRYSRGEYTNVIFLHHSTGSNLIEQGKVRKLFSQAGIDFWDQGYNADGLFDPNGKRNQFVYVVPEDNTDPEGLAKVFNQPVYRLPINTISGLLQYEVIILKSCFIPTSKIISDVQLEQYKKNYAQIREVMELYPDRLFILVTQPPLNPVETNFQEAARARELVDWLKSEEFVGGSNNVRIFDLFDLLANSDPTSPEYNMLRLDYRVENDSHPNTYANEQIGPVLVKFVAEAIQEYRLQQDYIGKFENLISHLGLLLIGSLD